MNGAGATLLKDPRTAVIPFVPGGGGGGGGDTGHGGTSPVDHGLHIGDYTKLAGDQLVVLEDGRAYDGGNTDPALSAHAHTGGIYGGWLVICAETLYGAEIDLSSTSLNFIWDGIHNSFTRKDLRILFVGFRVKLGMFLPEWVRYCRFFWCDISCPVQEWNAEQYAPAYHSRHGRDPIPGSDNFDDTLGLANFVPSVCRGAFADYMEWYFCDIHNVGDHLFFQNSCSNWLMQGCNAWDIWHDGIDYWNPPLGTDIFHNGLLCQSSSIKIYDCGMFFNFEADTNAGGGGCDVDIRRFWSMASYGVGFQFTEESTHKVTGQISGPALWGANGQFAQAWNAPGLPHYVSDFDTLQSSNIGGVESINNFPSLLHWYNGSGSDIGMSAFRSLYHTTTAGWPSGIVTVSGLLSDLVGLTAPPYDVPTLVRHPLNPANLDRAVAGHSAADWSTYFASNWV